MKPAKSKRVRFDHRVVASASAAFIVSSHVYTLRASATVSQCTGVSEGITDMKLSMCAP